MVPLNYWWILKASTPWDIAVVPQKDLLEFSFYIWQTPNVKREEFFAYAKVLAYFKSMLHEEDFEETMIKTTQILSSVNAFTEEEVKTFETIFNSFFCAFLAQKN